MALCLALFNLMFIFEVAKKLQRIYNLFKEIGNFFVLVICELVFLFGFYSF